MREFDGNDPITWLFYMNQYFDFKQMEMLQKENIASMFLE